MFRLDLVYMRFFRTHNSPCQSSKDVLDIGIVSPGLGNGDTQFSVAERSDGCDDTGDNPDDERQAHRAGVLQHAFRTNEDARANDVTWDKKTMQELIKKQKAHFLIQCTCLIFVCKPVDEILQYPIAVIHEHTREYFTGIS